MSAKEDKTADRIVETNVATWRRQHRNLVTPTEHEIVTTRYWRHQAACRRGLLVSVYEAWPAA